MFGNGSAGSVSPVRGRKPSVYIQAFDGVGQLEAWIHLGR